MGRPVSERYAVRSQIVDVLEARIKTRPAMEKTSAVVAKQSKNVSQPTLTIGLDLGIDPVGIACSTKWAKFAQFPLEKLPSPPSPVSTSRIEETSGSDG
jgi:hypothetical protein